MTRKKLKKEGLWISAKTLRKYIYGSTSSEGNTTIIAKRTALMTWRILKWSTKIGMMAVRLGINIDFMIHFGYFTHKMIPMKNQ